MKKLKVGRVEDIYLDYQSQKNFCGKARLIEYVKEGLSFYNDEDLHTLSSIEKFNSENPDSMIEYLPTIYSSEKWLVEFVDNTVYPIGFQKVMNIRKILYKGKDKRKVIKYTTYQESAPNEIREEEDGELDISDFRTFTVLDNDLYL